MEDFKLIQRTPKRTLRNMEKNTSGFLLPYPMGIFSIEGVEDKIFISLEMPVYNLEDLNADEKDFVIGVRVDDQGRYRLNIKNLNEFDILIFPNFYKSVVESRQLYIYLELPSSDEIGSVENTVENSISELSITELETKKAEAIAIQDYELAAHYRDEINRRNKKAS